jgi:uncharacterized protein (TIGR03663 family)
MVLWVGIGCLALALRVAGLGRAPLSSAEAQEAMASWDAVHAGARTASGYTPLLFVLNSALFAVCGASDALARLGPALCGTLLVLSPLAFRRQLGRLAALIAGAILALSPTAMVASRQLNGTVFAVTGATLALAEFLRYRAAGQRRYLLTAAGAAALALSTGGDAITTFVSILLAGAVVLLIWPDALERDWYARLRSDLHAAWLVLAGVLAALVAGLGWHPAGLGALGDSLAHWPERFRSGGSAVLSPLGLLALYEPLALLFGVGGLVHAARRGSRFGALLGLWAAAQLAVLTLSPAGHPLEALGCVLPLACLAGVAVAAVLGVVTNPQDWPAVRLYLPIVIVLWGYFYLTLMRYANTADSSDLLLALLVGLMQVLLAALFALATQPSRAAIAFAAATGLVLLVVTVSAGWGVAFVRATDPREPLLAQPTADEVRDLQHTLRELSWAETGLPSTLRLALEEPSSPVLRWYLRDFAGLESYVPGSGAVLPEVIVTARRELLLTDSRYIGQDFALARRWDPRTVECAWAWPPHCEAAARWWLLRRTPEPPEVSQWAVVWVQASDGE